MRARRTCGVLCAMAMLSACVTSTSINRVPDAAAQAALLRDLDQFTLEGRVAVRSGEEGWQASVRWRQRGAVSEVRLAGPFGAGALQLRVDGGVLTLKTSRGETLGGDEALGTLRQQLGFDPPIAELRHWLLAEPAPPDPPAVVEAGANGRPAQLQQGDWQIVFEDFRAQELKRAAVQMPRRLVATRGNVRLRLVVDKWRLGRVR